MTNKAEEIIIVAPRNVVFEDEVLEFQGNLTDQKKIVRIMQNINESYTTMRRGSTKEQDVDISKNAELNFDYKQPIPYVIIRKGDSIYAYERLEGGGESRLHGKLSTAFGGHMNAVEGDDILDSCIEEVIEENTIRELEEELEISGRVSIDPIGLINDDSEDVGRVHLGILGIINLNEEDTVSVRETDQIRGFWIKIEDLKKDKEQFDRLENWSKIAVELL